VAVGHRLLYVVVGHFVNDSVIGHFSSVVDVGIAESGVVVGHGLSVVVLDNSMVSVIIDHGLEVVGLGLIACVVCHGLPDGHGLRVRHCLCVDPWLVFDVCDVPVVDHGFHVVVSHGKFPLVVVQFSCCFKNCISSSCEITIDVNLFLSCISFSRVFTHFDPSSFSSSLSSLSSLSSFVFHAPRGLFSCLPLSLYSIGLAVVGTETNPF